MKPVLGILALLATASFALTPVLTDYPGYLTGKLSGFGLSAEIVVDGRKE